MSDKLNPTRSPAFRLLTVAASGFGGFMLSIWGIKFTAGSQIAGLPAEIIAAVLAVLCALAASLAALSFFAGVDESAEYFQRERQIDKLTGLLVRAAMSDRIAAAVTSTERSGRPVFLVVFEVDRFKQINDALGYSQGDQLIRAIGKRLQVILPPGMEIGRIGASEFAVLVPDSALNTPLDILMDELIAALRAPYQLPSHLQTVNLSAGVVALPKDGHDPVVLLRRSNLALQRARERGIGHWAVYVSDMGRQADHRQWMEGELHIAFERGDFSLAYQPQIDLRSGRTVGYEALVRWEHPERGPIPASEFIPVAEETGMILPLGEWVLRRACDDACHLPPDCFVAVNISPVQFLMKDFAALVCDVLATSQIAPHRLELEVTETAMMQDRERAARILGELADIGIPVAIDDFGTGYCNLSYLIDFRFAKLKIDQSFVKRMQADASSAVVVSTIVGLARALGVRTIAEGVETCEQATLLRAAGCDTVQGYLYGKPVPIEDTGDSDLHSCDLLQASA